MVEGQNRRRVLRKVQPAFRIQLDFTSPFSLELGVRCLPGTFMRLQSENIGYSRKSQIVSLQH